MLEDFNLDLQFFTSNSLVFSVSSNRNIEIHVHMGKYPMIYVTVIIADKSIALHLDKKSLNYVDKLFFELEMKLCSLIGFYDKGQQIEIYLHINFNSIRINFPPLLMYGYDYIKLKTNISSIIFDEIKKLKRDQLY